jgi:hypothetical protein
MKSLLGLIGPSPLHISRPSLAVVLNLINTFDLDPDTLEEIHKQVYEVNYQHLFPSNPSLACQPQASSCGDNLTFLTHMYFQGIEIPPPESHHQSKELTAHLAAGYPQVW